MTPSLLLSENSPEVEVTAFQVTCREEMKLLLAANLEQIVFSCRMFRSVHSRPKINIPVLYSYAILFLVLGF